MEHTFLLATVKLYIESVEKSFAKKVQYGLTYIECVAEFVSLSLLLQVAKQLT